jgi:hypothetical protein
MGPEHRSEPEQREQPAGRVLPEGQHLRPSPLSQGPAWIEQRSRVERSGRACAKASCGPLIRQSSAGDGSGAPSTSVTKTTLVSSDGSSSQPAASSSWAKR